MALLSQLEYYGIRSVPGNSRDSHHIEFEAPLTIISGPNGSGKTTLIEALKFVTANESPPGDKQAFVHNLHIARSTRVDGLIRLEFLTDKGKKVTVTKRFNVVKNARTKGGIQFKSDESTINVFDDAGQQKSISSKNADFQTEVLNHLGVPAAILSNVIFCHQEDSCWPLSEPKELKQRFDKIFQLQKFTKAIEQAKKIKKAEMGSFKTLDAETKHAELLLRNKGKCLKDKEESKASQTEIVKQLEELDGNIKNYTLNLKNMEIELKQIERKKNRRDTINAELGVLVDVVRQMEKQGVVPHEGSLEELQEQSKLAQQQLDNEEKQECMRDLQELQRALERKQLDKQLCQQVLNEVTRKRENYDEEFAKFKQLEREIRQRFPEITDANIMQQLPSFLLERMQLLNSAKETHREARLELERECDKAVENQGCALSDMQHIVDSKQNIIKDIDKIQQKCAAIDGSDEQESKINHRLAELKIMSQGLPQANDEQSRILQIKRVQLRKELEELRNESLRSAEYEEQVKERKRIASEIDLAREKYEGLIDKHKDDIKTIFLKLPEGMWREQVQAKKDEINSLLNRTSDKLSKCEFVLQSERSIYNNKCSEEEQLLAQARNLKEDIKKKCNCEIESLSAEAANVATQLKKSRKELAPLNTKSDLYEVWINETTQKSCCPLCERKFAGKDGSQSLVEKLNNMTLSLPDDIARLTQEVSQLELREKILSSCLADAEKLISVESSLEECRKRKMQAERQQVKYEADVIEATNEHSKVKQLFDRISKIMADVSLIDNLLTSINSLNQQLSALHKVDEDAMSSETLRCKIHEREKTLKSLETEMDEVDFRKQKRNEIDTEMIKLRGELVKLSEYSGQKSNLEEQLRAKQFDLEEFDKKRAFISAQLPGLEESVRETKLNRAKCEQDFAQREKSGEKEIREIEDYQRNLERQNLRMQQLFVPQDQFDNLNKQMKELEIECNNCLLRKAQAESNSSYYKDLVERNRYIARQIDLYQTSSRMRILEAEIQELGLPENGIVEEMEKEYQSLLQKKNKSESKKSNLEGQLGEIEKKLKETRAILQKEEIKKAEVTFRNSLVAKNVSEKIIEDLDSFVTVLDTSILKFHKDKMTAINVILDDLWRRVYNGVDIETIKIKTEKNESSDKRASYDYNVMMVLEGGIEVGMRDRCSAGQKMLASLLIRIALADVFAKTCSIIALDEPTTNLDTSKIEQMAAMLNTLINARRADDKYGNVHGKQFQMIVITHDNRLVDALKLGCRPNKVFKLSKDPLSGKSRLDTYDYAGNRIG